MQYLLGLAIILNSSYALASKDLPIKAAAHANSALMSSPPLAAPFQKKTWSLSIRPAYIKVDQSMDPQDPKELKYDGFGGSVFANFPLNRYMDAYGLIFGNELKGDFTGPGPNNSTTYPIYANDVSVSTYQLATGVSYDPLAGTSFALPIFIGPAYVMTKLGETITHNSPSSNEDFDLRLNGGAMMLYGGLQGAMRIGKHFSIGFFAVTSQHLDEEEKCQSYETTVRSTGFFFDLSDPDCQDGQNSSTSKVEYDLSLTTYGLTLGIPTWGISLVAYSDSSSVKYFEGVEQTIYQFTVSL